jgi:hypothetical protein
MWPQNTTHAEQDARTLNGLALHYRRPRRDSSKRAILFLFIFLLLAVCLFASVSRAAQPKQFLARVTGTVFVENSAGCRSAVAGANVTLNGPTLIETKTDEDGTFSVSSVPCGTYQGCDRDGIIAGIGAATLSKRSFVFGASRNVFDVMVSACSKACLSAYYFSRGSYLLSLIGALLLRSRC